MFDIAENSIIEEGVLIGDGTKIWYYCHVCKGAKIGMNCNIGDQCYIGKGVIIGNDVRIGNNVSIYEGVIIKDGVFIGNGATFTNVRYPKVNKKVKKYADTIIDDNVSIGANATIVAGCRIGKDSVIADGSVVIGDVEEGFLVAGNPAHKKKRI